MKEYISQLKSYDFYSQFKPGYYLDAYDEHKWKVGQIKEITKYGLRTTIQLHFDGYSARYDSGYDLPSSHKLAPFRTHTLPYTGPSTVEPKRDEPTHKLAAYTKEFAKLIANEKTLDKIKPSQINQFLRGELFIAADYIITKRNIEGNFEEASTFLLEYLKHGCRLLNICGELLKELQKENFDVGLFNVHPKIALLLSATEVLFIINSIVGNKDNRAEIQKNYEKWIQASISKKTRQLANEAKIINVCDKIMEFKAANGRSLPWSLKKEACLLLSQLREGYVFPTPTDHREIIEILDYMSYLSLKGLLQRDEEEKKTLNLIVSLIISGNFEGRLRGLNELKKILEYYLRKKDYIINEIQSTQLLSFLIDNKNFNPEIFKRSLPLFSFCFSNKLMTKKDLSQILNLHKDKHELDIKAFYATLAEFPCFLDVESTISFFKDIITILPLNEMSVQLTKDYTITAITKNTTLRQSYCKEGFELGLTYYWSLVTTEKAEISSELKYKIIQAIASMLGDFYYSKEVEKYISLSLKGIANRKNLQFYFKIIHETLKLSKSTMRIGKNIEAIEKEVNIVDCVIDGLRSRQTMSDKIWECMFEFLEEVTYVSKKRLNFVQVKEFWSIRECRVYLLKLLRKFRLKGDEDKSQQKIINKQLPLETMKEVITKIFLDAREMEDYVSITPELYQTVDELLIAFNHNTKGFDYNYKHTIRVRSLENIFGYEFYINVINNCKQKEIVEKSIHRLVQFFMRVKDGYRNIESVKLNNWNFILEKLSKLKRNVLLGYRIFLEDLNGRMKSLNILQPDLVQLLVLNKSTGIKKLMAVPRFTSLWKFRHLIAEEFNLPNLNFDMQLGSQFSDTNFEKEEDFSMALITISKESHSVIIVQTKNRYPHLETLDTFYKSFADLKGDELFEWLNKEEDSKQALEILNKLPFVKRIQEKIMKVSFKEMNDILDSNSIYKLCYQLRIIMNDKNPKLIVNLIEKGFIPYISKIFLNNQNFRKPQFYTILTVLMELFNDLVKFSKTVKSAQLFPQAFLIELLHINKLQSQEYVNYIAKCFSFLRDLAVNKEVLASSGIKPGVIFETKHFEKVFENIILSKTKEKISENLVEFAKVTNNEQNLMQIANRLLKSEVLLQKQESCRNLFYIISLLLEKKVPSTLMENLKTLIRAIQKFDIMQQSEQIENQLLIGYLTIILRLVKSKIGTDALEDILGDKIDKFASFIINDCLFNIEEPNKIKFKTSALRALGYEFLEEFQYSRVGNKLSAVIFKAMRNGGSWRRQDQWSIVPTKQVTHKYTGLKNLAATCYINSLLQQLFFIENFRDQIIGIDAQTIDDKENIVLELQNIFAHLKYSESPIYTTSSLCKKFILDGQPIDPRVQTDVDEFFHSLMDKLQRNLSKINKKEVINNIFGGELSNLIVGSVCEHTSERIEPFLSIRLEIKEKKSLEQALKDFIKGEVLEGDNAYFCERCDAKIKAMKRVCLKTLPEILIVTLKRFEFDYETMEKFKLNTFCSFPNIVNVLPFTRDGIDNDYEADTSQYEYRLKGVVIHYGISEAGHYTSYIQTQSDKWQYFDDEKITEFNREELGAESFGGIEENPFGDDEEKKKNAYLLFYEKIKKNAPKQAFDLTEAPIMKEIKEENTRIKLVNLLFEPTIQNYIYKLGSNKEDPRIFLTYLHLVFLRSARKKEKLELFYNTAEFILKNQKDIATWYLNQINESFLYEFLFYSELQAKYIVTGLIIEAFKTNTNIQTGFTVLEQLCGFIGKKNLLPAYKIIISAIKTNKAYEKYLRQIGLSDMILITVKNFNKEVKIAKQSELKIKRTQNQFGFANCTYTDRGMLDQIDLLQCIDGLKVNLNLEDLQPIVKRARKSKTQESIAIIIARRYCELESFAKIQQMISEKLSSLECSLQDEHVFTFYIHLTEQYALLKDQFSPKRAQRLALVYLKAIGDSIGGYRSELLLLLGLFRICAGNSLFRDKISEQLQEKDGKRLLKEVKTWLKEVNSNLGIQIRTGRLGFWRKAEQKAMSFQTLSFYLESEDKINYQKCIAALNAIVQRHNTFFSTGDERFLKDDTVKYGREKFKIGKQYGLLAEIENGERARLVCYEDLGKIEYFC